MRQIDADALKKQIEDFHCKSCDNYNFVRCRACGIDNTISYLEEAPTVGGWISVEDRLPETGVNVLAVKQLKSGQRNIALAYCIREYCYKDPVTKQEAKRPYWVCGGNNNVIFWMPLPEMPLEVDK